LVTRKDLQDPAIIRLITDSFHDYHTLPIDSQRLATTIGHAHGMSELRSKVAAPREGDNEANEMVGASAVMKDLSAAIRKVAPSSAPVLITGESGTGKELVARAIHRRSQFAKGPFVPINCASIPPTLIESELFGYERGAFTGAYKRKKGLIETAANGTVFLDEIGDLNPSVQASLLRFLQEKVVQRVGGNVTFPVETRVIAATNANLDEAVSSGQFREDLFFRLSVLHIETPPLRDRERDAELLAHYYLRLFAREEQRQILGFSKDALSAIATHHWPGNVRELVNRIRRAVVMCSGSEIHASDLALASQSSPPPAPSLESMRETAELNGIRWALAQSDYNWSKAATLLRVSRSTLYRIAERHGFPAARGSERPVTEAQPGRETER
jgi:DNA-binding NtrC family response regulator